MKLIIIINILKILNVCEDEKIEYGWTWAQIYFITLRCRFQTPFYMIPILHNVPLEHNKSWKITSGLFIQLTNEHL